MSRRKQLEEMLASDPDDAFLNYALAKELLTAGETTAALAAFDRVITLHPDYVPAYFQKGQALAETGEIEAARAVLTDGITVAERTRDTHAAAEMTDFLESLS